MLVVRPMRSTRVSWTPCSRGSSSCWRPWATAQTSPALPPPCQRFWRSRWEVAGREGGPRPFPQPPTAWPFCRRPLTPPEPTLAPLRSPLFGCSSPTNRGRWYVYFFFFPPEGLKLIEVVRTAWVELSCFSCGSPVRDHVLVTVCRYQNTDTDNVASFLFPFLSLCVRPVTDWHLVPYVCWPHVGFVHQHLLQPDSTTIQHQQSVWPLCSHSFLEALLTGAGKTASQRNEGAVIGCMVADTVNVWIGAPQWVIV